MPEFALIVAQTAPVPPASKSGLLRSAASLWLMMAIVALLVLAMTWWALARRRRAMLLRTKQRPRVIADAWAESARRAEPITVDLDPPLDSPTDDDGGGDDDDEDRGGTGRRR